VKADEIQPDFSLTNPFCRFPGRWLFDCIQPFLLRLTGLTQLEHVLKEVNQAEDAHDYCERILSVLRIPLVLREEERARISKHGPLVVVANHPFGGVDAALLACALCRARPDVKFLANYLLKRVPGVKDLCHFVDPFVSDHSAERNVRSLLEALRWVKAGHALAVFPAGEVSSLDLRRGTVADRTWDPTVVLMARRTNAPVLPVFIRGRNSALFQAAGLIHPLLRTARLPREVLNKRGRAGEIRVGQLVPAKQLASLEDDRSAAEYLRTRVYMMGIWNEAAVQPRSVNHAGEPIAPTGFHKALVQEVEDLPETNVLVDGDEFRVMLARADRIPETLYEIARLREITFRDAGEGTGMASDRDRYDNYYLHLFLWNRKRKEVVGAYRLGPTDEILPKLGAEGLYTHTLFDYAPEVLSRLNPALELGRSFVRPEYQQAFTPLMLLWKGIGQFALRHPRYRLLFGPVSINNEYHYLARQLIVAFLQAHAFLDDWAGYIKPRRPFRVCRFKGWDVGPVARAATSIDEISALISDLDPKHKTVPVLLRQYLRLGGKLLGFNIDPAFSSVLDGLLLVDLTQTDRRMLNRYMGAEGAETFLQFHVSTQQEPRVEPAHA